MNQFEKSQAAKILSCYGVVNTDLNKGGVGSGRKIGTTCSDKDVYDFPHDSAHHNFTSQDHHDASLLHSHLGDKHYKNAEDAGSLDEKHKHKDIAGMHYDYADTHEKMAKDKFKSHIPIKKSGIEATMKEFKDGTLTSHGHPVKDRKQAIAIGLSEADKMKKAEFSEDEREKLADEGEAENDGSYPIRNEQDLHNAIHAFGRSKDKAKTKAWIKKRAKELGKEDILPDTWKSEDDNLKKGGIGSGRKIGMTRSNKPIYDTFEHPEHKFFNKKDHEDARDAHYDLMGKLNTPSHEEAHHFDQAFRHYQRSKNLKKSQNIQTFDDLYIDLNKGNHTDIIKGTVSNNGNYIYTDKGWEHMRIVKGRGEDIDELIKGGEGSKGGHIIGHTKSGKPIYDDLHHSSHHDFSKQDHLDAANTHYQLAKKHEEKNPLSTSESILNQNIIGWHKDYAKAHEKMSNNKN